MAQNSAESEETPAAVQEKPAGQEKAAALGHPAFLYATAVFFTTTLFLWWNLDHSYPFWDGAAHVKDSMAYANLFKHAHIFKGAWIKQFLTVNYDYPLTIHAINGAIKAIVGFNRTSDMVALLLYQLVLIFAISKLSLHLLKDKFAAWLAAVFVCSYPLVSILSHVPLLDLGYLAFTALGLMGVAIYDKNPGWRQAVIMGIALALGSTSKQIAVLFLLGPCIMLLIAAIKNKQWLKVQQLALAAVFPAVGLLLWVVPNSKALAAWRDYYKNDSALSGGIVPVFFDHLMHYVGGLTAMLSPWLLLFAIVAAIYLWRAKPATLKAQSIPLCSTVCGLVLMSSLALNRPELRYVIPVAISAAILSGAMISEMFSLNRTLKVVASLVVACTIGQYLLFNFTPYPIPASAECVNIINACAGHNAANELVEPRPSPLPAGDKWGQEWVVAEIDKVDHGHKSKLNIMPSTPDLSVHTIDLVCIYAGTQIEPSTFRQFTLHGDLMPYNEQAINYYDWYLLKTGYQGTKLATQADKDNYQKILAYIENPSNYSLAGQRDLPDGSVLKLYHRQKK